MTFRAISINKAIYDKPVDAPQEILKMGQVNIKLFLPPSDTPQYIFATQDKNKDIFCINFQYSNQEKEKNLFDTELANLIIGEFSGKPIRIEIKNVNAHRIDVIALTNIIRDDISQLIQAEMNKLGGLSEKSNLIKAREILTEKAQEIAQEMALAGA